MNSEDNALDAALRDPLTGLFNRAYFQREVESTLRRAVRSQNAFSVLLVRIVHLEKVQQSGGTEAADRVRIAFANAVRTTLRSTDEIARHENDDLLILLPDTGGLVAEHVAGKLVDPLLEAAAHHEPVVSFAIGIATYPDNAVDVKNLMLHALEALTSALEAELPSIVRSVYAAPLPPPAWVSRQLSRETSAQLVARRKTPDVLEAWERHTLTGTDTPLRAEDWKSVMGTWRLDGDEWVSEGSTTSVLVSRIPIVGSFQFVCEAWNEGPGEISILGHSFEGKNSAHWGYAFHVGADGNTCTKLTRLGMTVMTLPDCTIEPNRHYQLEMHYDDGEGRLTCFLNGQRLFDYQERRRFPGYQIGLYAWGAGAHIKPLEIRCIKHRRLSAMDLADELMQEGSHELALQSYTALYSSCTTPLEAAQARLKSAVCLIAMNKAVEGRRILQSFRDTELEPYALAEEGSLSFRTGERRVAIEIFEDLFRRFPESNARHMALQYVGLARSRELWFDDTRRSDLDLRGRFNKLAQDSCVPPSYAQSRAAIEWARVNWQLGAWPEALENLLQFQRRLSPSQYDVADFRQTLFVSALANGREDLLPADPSISQTWSLDWAPDWCSGILLHAVVRKGNPAQFIEEYLAAAKVYPQIDQLRDLRKGVVALYLAQSRVAEAAQFLNTEIYPKFNLSAPFEDYFWCYWLGGVVVESGDAGLFNDFQNVMRPLLAQAGARSPMARALSILDARWNVEHGEFDVAAAALDGWDEPALVFHFSEGLVLQALLASLKVLKAPSLDMLNVSLDHRLAGVELELAEIFLRHKEPLPNARWPHARWRPEFRVWLARWLLANGRPDAARAIAEPAVDARYGLTHSQAALAAVLQGKDKLAVG